VYFAILVITFAEGRTLDESLANDTSVFKVIYEVVSAFGTVGFSMGYQERPYSYSGVLTPTSKFMIALIMMLGRHRGLPSSDDPAVVPSNYASLRAYRARRRRLISKLKEQQERERMSSDTSVSRPSFSDNEDSKSPTTSPLRPYHSHPFHSHSQIDSPHLHTIKSTITTAPLQQGIEKEKEKEMDKQGGTSPTVVLTPPTPSLYPDMSPYYSASSSATSFSSA